MTDHLGSEIKRGLAWNFAEQVSFKLMQFVIQLVLTRLLMPEDYGLVALSLAFVNFANVFVTAGFGSALVYKKDALSVDFSSVCWFSIFVSILLYIILFCCAPFVADFYEDERIVSIIRVMALSLLLGALNSVQISIVQKYMQFKKSFIGNVVGVVVSSILGIFAAYSGYGVWALVIQYIANRIISLLSFYILTRWLPKIEFSWHSIRDLFSYGWKLMMSNILSTISTDIYSLVVGKYFSKAQLGTYDTGVKIPANLGNTVSTTLGTVLFPAFSKLQGDTSLIKVYLQKSNVLGTFIVFPMLYLLAGLANPLVLIVFTEKWIDSVPFLQIACFTYSFYPIHLANLQVAKAVGRTDIGLCMEVGKKSLDIIMLIITLPFGIHWVAIGLSFSTFCALWINIEPIKKYIDYSTLQQLRDIFPTWLISAITGGTVYYLTTVLTFSPAKLLLIGVCVGSTLFVILSLIFNKNTTSTIISQLSVLLRHVHK